jgi:hypothetical protein
MRIPLHAPSDWPAVFHFVASLTNLRVPLSAPFDWSPVSHFVPPLTNGHVPLHAPSDWPAVFHFVSLLIGIHAIYIFLLFTYTFFSFSRDFDTAFAAAVIAPALVTAMIQTES